MLFSPSKIIGMRGMALATPTGGVAPPSGSTWNPLDKGLTIALSNGNLTASQIVNPTSASVRNTVGKTTGKWYWELTVGTGVLDQLFGICDSTVLMSTAFWSSPVGWGYYCQGQKINNNVAVGGGTVYNSGDIVRVALDMGAGKVWFGVNAGWYIGGDPASGTTPTYTGITGTIFPVWGGNTDASITANFSTTFAQAVPAGFTAYG